MTSTGNPGLDVLVDAMAERFWEKLQARQVPEAAQLISIPESARRLGISKTKLHGMIASGEFPKKAVRNMGRRTLILVSEMDRWLSQR